MTENSNYYSIIPMEVLLDRNISDKAKLIYTELSSLDSKAGYAWCSNKYLAELFNTTIKTVSRTIKELVQAKYIKCEYETDNARKIFLLKVWTKMSKPMDKNVPTYGQESPEPMDKNVPTYGQESPEPMDKNVPTYGQESPDPMDKNVPQESIDEKVYLESIDEKVYLENIDGKKLSKKDLEKMTHIQIINAYIPDKDIQVALLEFIKMRKMIKKPITNYGLKLVCEKLIKDFSPDDWMPVIQQSIMNNWQGLFPLKNYKMQELEERALESKIKARNAYVKDVELKAQQQKTTQQKNSDNLKIMEQELNKIAEEQYEYNGNNKIMQTNKGYITDISSA